MSTSISNLAGRIREETSQDHQQAEGGGFLGSLTRADVSVGAYRDFLVQMLPIYQAIDEAARQYRQAGQLVNIFDERLDRVQRLEADIRNLEGDSALLPETEAYVSAIQAAAKESPALLVAHHYTRYLGDLSGGQFIGRAIAKSYGDAVAGSLSWFNFEELGDLNEFKDAYRQSLNEMNLTEDETVKLIDEVHLAYKLNTDVLNALGRIH